IYYLFIFILFFFFFFFFYFFFFQAEDGIRDGHVTGVQTCALPIFFGGNDRLAQRQNAPVLREYEDIILEDDGAHARVRTHDTLQHLYTFFCIEPRNARDTSLGLVQEVRGRAESATHGAVVERDQAHRADLGKSRLASRLRRQGADAVRLFEPVPVAAVRHLFIGRAEDRVPQLRAVESPLRHSHVPPVSGALRGSGDPTQGRPGAQSRDQLEHRALALPQHDAVEGRA